MTRSIICWTSVILFLVIMGNPIFARDNVRLRSPDEARQDSILDLIGEEFDESMLDELMGMEEGPSGAIEDYTIGYTKTEGMFTYYTDETTRQVLIALDTEQLDHTYFLSLTLSGGTGDFMFTAPMMWGQMPFLFHRDGESVEFVEPNYAITTVMGEPMAGAVEAGVSDTILGRAYIEAEDVDDGRVLIDLSTFLLTVSGLDAMGLYTGLMIMVDYEGSYVEEIKGFPLNDEIDARVLVYGAGDATGYSPMGAQELGLHYSLSEPPEPGFVPRLADDRLGFFLDMSMNYSVATDREDTRMVRYVNRWRLEKQDPDAELSPPIEPIVFWLENTIPYEYRDAVEEGILAWNKAYERIGFENAIEVYQMPDDADWDPADIRYNTIRWFVSPSSNYAIGPSITDPRTGEIYAADIGVNADMMRSIHLEYELTVGPIQEGALELLLPPGWPNLGHRQVPWDEETLDILERQMDFVQRNGSHCLYSAMMQFEAARGLEILCGCCAGEEPNTEAEERFVHDYLVGLICHEVGHTLGMAHNFAGSAATPYENLNDIYWTQQHGLSSSIMDYTTSNIAPIGTDQGEYFQSVPGDYDNWVIEYAYTQTNAELPEDEIGIMSEIASRSPQYRYGSQIETFGWTRNMDPDLETWDLSDNIQNTYRDSFEQSEFLLDGILERYSEPGTRPVKIRRAFIYALWPYFRAALAVPRKIGGIRAYYDHIGDPDARPAMIPVSAEEQREALRFINDNLWSSEPFRFEPELVNMLGRESQWGFDWLALISGTRDFDVHDWILMIQSEPFYWLYDAMVLERVLNNELRMPDGGEAFTLVELFETVRACIWMEVADRTSIDSYRRNLQRAHLEMIAGIMLDPAYGTPEDAITLARNDLLVLKGQISSLLNSSVASRLDTMTRAHLDECLSRISLTLIAPMDRGSDSMGFIFLY